MSEDTLSTFAWMKLPSARSSNWKATFGTSIAALKTRFSRDQYHQSYSSLYSVGREQYRPGRMTFNNVLLAAGLGTRLKPFTFFCAKAALPMFDLPFICYPLQYLHANGVTEVVINLHAHPDTVRSAAGSEYRGMRIHYSHEPEILGTAGAIWKAKELLGNEPFAVLNGDIFATFHSRRCCAGIVRATASSHSLS
jgi:UTP-glucose-1-phosphate uridylyltransferase